MSFGVANRSPQEPEKDWLQDRGYLRGPQNSAHRRVLRSCQPRTRRARLFPWRPVENFLVPHPTCPRAVMCQSFRKRACLIFGTRTISQNILSRLLVIDLQASTFRTILAMKYRPAVWQDLAVRSERRDLIRLGWVKAAKFLTRHFGGWTLATRPLVGAGLPRLGVWEGPKPWQVAYTGPAVLIRQLVTRPTKAERSTLLPPLD